MAIHNFIWDLDGTLIDSYGVIVSSITELLKENKICIDPVEINKQVIATSVGHFLNQISNSMPISGDELKRRYDEISNIYKESIKPVKHAKDILSLIEENGSRNFVFTHRGSSSLSILKNIGLYGFFDEIITSQNAFPRKPEPDALIYLLEKYNLDIKSTCYVGDRTIDMECAKNAQIDGILYLPDNSYCIPNGCESHTVNDLIDIKDFLQ